MKILMLSDWSTDAVNGWIYAVEDNFDSHPEDCLSLSYTSSLRDNAEKTAFEFSSLRFADRIEEVYRSEIEKRRRDEA